MPQTQKIIEIAKWADISTEWLLSGRGKKQLDAPTLTEFTSEQIARVVQVMEGLAPYEQEIIASQAEALKQTFRNRPEPAHAVQRPEEAA